MAVTTEMIKELRGLTAAGVLDCKRALEEAGGDMAEAAEILRRQGLADAAKKAGRVANEGRIEPYIHPGNKLAALVELSCETDFVARTEEFIALSHDLAMQVAAANPLWVSREEIPAEVLEELKEGYRAELAGDNKPAEIVERAIEGKLEKYYRTSCLLEQPFIRDDEKPVRDLITEAIAVLGENIVVRRFARMKIG